MITSLYAEYHTCKEREGVLLFKNHVIQVSHITTFLCSSSTKPWSTSHLKSSPSWCSIGCCSCFLVFPSSQGCWCDSTFWTRLASDHIAARERSEHDGSCVLSGVYCGNSFFLCSNFGMLFGLFVTVVWGLGWVTWSLLESCRSHLQLHIPPLWCCNSSAHCMCQGSWMHILPENPTLCLSSFLGCFSSRSRWLAVVIFEVN